MSRGHIVVFSGGSAANSLVDVFGGLAGGRGACLLSYIIPISDNGGSSSELIRVFGGPGIGDVRSRLVRLIPEDPSSSETTAIKTLFNYRLSPDPSLARIEWLDIVEARHQLWTSISSEKRELIRSLFNTINLEIVKRLRPTSSFNFQSASVGNLFLTGARLFTGSFESAIYLLSAITGVPSNVAVIPAINSNFSHHISAGLQDGTQITGQNAISHPSAPSAPHPSTSEAVSQQEQEEATSSSTTPRARTLSRELSEHDTIEDANLPGSLPTLRKQYITFAKTHTADLPSRIQRVWYINPYGQEIRPAPNPKVLWSIADASAVIYSIGSLFTSIIPCLVLKDVGARIAAGSGGGGGNAKFKILILNGSLDRETRAGGVDFTARDFVAAIADACARSNPSHSPSSATSITTTTTTTTTTASAAASAAAAAAIPADQKHWKTYITHVIHLQGAGTPHVEREELMRAGIEVIRVYGRKLPDADDGGGGGGMVYDGNALRQALEAVIGGGAGSGAKGNVRAQSRRNTLGVGVGVGVLGRKEGEEG